MLPSGEGAEQAAQAASSGPAFTFDEVRYVLYRHKWKIMFFTLLGLMAAAAVYRLTPRLYVSEAKVMVKYVTDMEPVGSAEAEGHARSPVLRGEAVVNSEVEILQNLDLAIKAAQTVGPERVLAMRGGGNDAIHAGLVVRGGIRAEVLRRGNVIRVTFEHPDPTVVQPVLASLINHYFEKHFEIHLALAGLDEFADQRKKLEERLQKTEQTLWGLKKTNAIFSVETAKKTSSERIFRIQQSLVDAETELAQAQAAVDAIKAGMPKESVLPDPKGREERLAEYQRVLSQLDLAGRRKSEFLGQYREGSGMVEPIQRQIEKLEQDRRKLESEDPTLPHILAAAGGRDAGRDNDAFSEFGRVLVLKAKVDALNANLARAREEEEKLYELEGPIVELQRTKDLEENRYRYFSSALDLAQINSGLGTSRVANIRRVQDPTPPGLDIGPLYKRVGVCAAAGLGFGLLAALVLEFFVDQSVKRPKELRRLTPAPVYISIPRAGRREAARLNRLARKELAYGKEAPEPTRQRGMEAHLQPYLDALRDRILNRFESLARKPKLVGVCGCVPGSGVTSIAAGLAASLSEAGDLKVLLVDMKRGHGRPHPMLGKRKGCTLAEALEGPKRQDALIGPNLYLATANGGGGKQQLINSPRKFNTVVPQLNTSDYDYIIFDLPLVDEVSITPRLAKFMDLTLLVVEAEKARRSTVSEAGSLLLEFSPNVAVVVNKTRNYLPGLLSQAA
jgi:polysaccharide biosynthesis transport protein